MYELSRQCESAESGYRRADGVLQEKRARTVGATLSAARLCVLLSQAAFRQSPDCLFGLPRRSRTAKRARQGETDRHAVLHGLSRQAESQQQLRRLPRRSSCLAIWEMASGQIFDQPADVRLIVEDRAGHTH